MSRRVSNASYWDRPLVRGIALARAGGVLGPHDDGLRGKRYWRKLYEEGRISLRTAKAEYAAECRAAQRYLLQRRAENALVKRDERIRNANVRAELRAGQVADKMLRGTALGIRLAAAYIRKAAMLSIKVDPKPAPVGHPVHSRRGQARRAIRYAVEARDLAAVVGPIASEVGFAMNAHEFGGEYYGRRYVRRSVMGPALERCAPYIAAHFKATVTAAS